MSLLVVSCAKPDSVKTIKSPTSNVFLTIEFYAGNSPVSADDMRLYANFSQNGAIAKALILEGENLEIKKLSWTKPDHLIRVRTQ
jgi:hypothetical protein